MGCNLYTLTGLNASCKKGNKGGIKRIYVAPYNAVVYTINELTHTIVPELLLNNEVFTYTFGKNAASFTSTYDRSTDKYSNEINLRFNVMDSGKREEIMGLLNSFSVIIAVDKNDNIWYFGKDNYVQCTSSSAYTNRNKNEANGYTMRFTDVSDSLPYGVTPEDLYNFINPRTHFVTFTSRQDNTTIALTKVSNPTQTPPELVYTKNGHTWYYWDYSPITINSGETLYMCARNSNVSFCDPSTEEKYYRFSTTGTFDLDGDIRALINRDASGTTVPTLRCFVALFAGTGVVNVNSNFLSGYDTLTHRCYHNMFRSCINLVNAPELPAVNLAENCYNGMFAGCTSLTTAPELLATNLNGGCNYYEMFKGCTSLVNPPSILPVGKESAFEGMFYGCTSLTRTPIMPSNAPYYCCVAMFKNCTSLVTAPALPATTVGQWAYMEMFQGCTSLVNPPVLAATNLTEGCYTRMFKGCTSLVTPPALPATTLANNCYDTMFYGCTSLTTAPELPATTLATACYVNMFNGCTSLTTAPALPSPTLNQNSYYRMFMDCTNLNYIKCLATDISADGCTMEWVKNVADQGTFVKSIRMNSWTRGDNGIPTNWIIDGNANYVSFTSRQNGTTVSLISSGDPRQTAPELIYSIDGENWYDWDYSAITINSGETFYVCANDTNVSFGDPNDGNRYYKFSTTGTFDLGGDIRALMNRDASGTTVPADRCFLRLFEQTGVVNVDSDFLSGYTTLTEGCYARMFNGCTSLTTAPDLPATTLVKNCYLTMFKGTAITTAPDLSATTLAYGCYSEMFYGCISLTTAPELPATTLATSCYESMFRDCTSLTTAPDLTVATLVTRCYALMFNGCTSLNYIKCLATNISATNCTSNWVSNVANSGTFVKTAYMTSWTIGVNGIPTNWVTEDYANYVTFTAQAANSSIGLEKINHSSGGHMWYSRDGINWSEMSTSTSITLTQSGDSVYIRGTGSYGSVYPTQFKMTGKIAASGDANYLFNYSNPKVLHSGCGYAMFKNCTALTKAPDLPATTLANDCYGWMFAGCTSLTTAPELPATTLANYCYLCMFKDCTNLTTAPTLPARTLNKRSYSGMFNHCTKLTTAPTISATTLAEECCYEMFYNCTSLTTAPELPATRLADYCYEKMFFNCTSLTTAPAILPATTLAVGCYSGMFNSCRSLTTAPELPATTLTSYCYYEMFSYCTNLNYIKCLAINKASYSTRNWVAHLGTTGTFVKSASASWNSGASGIPSGWTIRNA